MLFKKSQRFNVQHMHLLSTSSKGRKCSILRAFFAPTNYNNGLQSGSVSLLMIQRKECVFLDIFWLFPLGHIRDPNNQLHVVKNLRICVNNVTTSSSAPSAALSQAQCRVLHDVVSSCQPHEGAVTNVLTAGDYDLSVTGKNCLRTL